MTRTEFMGQFDRLCKGFRYDATGEQTEAWFRRIGQAFIADWSEAVTTLLCAPRFPLLDSVLAAIETVATHRRRTQVAREKHPMSMLARLASEGGRGCPLSPELVASITAFAGREHVRKCLDVVNRQDDRDPVERDREFARLAHEEQRLTAILTDRVPRLNESEIADFIAHYGQAVAS